MTYADDVVSRLFASLLLSVAAAATACNGDFLEVQELVEVSVPCGDIDAVEQQFELRESLYQDVPRRPQYLFAGVTCAELPSDGVHVWVDPGGSEAGTEIGVACGHPILVSDQLVGDYPIGEDDELHAAMVRRLGDALCP